MEKERITTYLCNAYHNNMDIKSPIRPSYLQGFISAGSTRCELQKRKKRKIPKSKTQIFQILNTTQNLYKSSESIHCSSLPSFHSPLVSTAFIVSILFDFFLACCVHLFFHIKIWNGKIENLDILLNNENFIKTS